MTTIRQQAIDAFIATTSFAGALLHPLAGDASFRRYIRLTLGSQSAMLMDAPPERENVRPFIAVAERLVQCGYSAPRILARDEQQGFLLLEDLGDETFSRILRGDASQEEALYTAAIDALCDWHRAGSALADTSQLRLPLYDTTLLFNEIRLFSDWYLPQVMGQHEALLYGGEWLDIWHSLLREHPLATDQFVHRDFHADNLMWLPQRSGHARLGLLDFQDAVYGDAAYDLVSLLEDARRDVPPALTKAMLERYCAQTGCDSEQLHLAYALLAAQRNSKIVGIFTRLAARDGKQHYLNYLPRVWQHLQHDLEHPALRPLRDWVNAHIPAMARGIITLRYDSKALGLSA
jgi:N-acetylmuramate 1-kinase